MSNGQKETESITTFKKWPFADDFRIETDDGKVLSALCKYCSKVECNDFMLEAMSGNIKLSSLKSICFFSRKCYIYSSKYIYRHLGL